MRSWSSTALAAHCTSFSTTATQASSSPRGVFSTLEEQVAARLKTTDANDLLYQVESSRSYDPSPQLERITAPLLAINSADDFINPPELGLMESLIKRVRLGRYVLLPITDATRGHGTHTLPAVWGAYLEQFLAPLR